MNVIDARSEPMSRRSYLRNLVLRLAPTSRTLRIETDDAQTAGYVRAAYGNVLAPESSAATNAARFVTSTGRLHRSIDGIELPGHGPSALGTSWDSHAYAVDQCVWQTLAQDGEWLAVYGCAVTIDQRAVLLVGPSGVGKTTLTIALGQLGAQVMGDEMIVLHRRDATVDAVDRGLSVRSGDARVIVDRRTFGDVAQRGPLAATFVLSRGAGEAAITPASVNRTALRIAPYIGAGRRTFADVADMAGILAQGRCFDLVLGDAESSARAICTALGVR
jgi:ABC-type uncharacterized transport system YnjBCD ATPase subunit